MQANSHETQEDLWRYNCRDCVYTRECGEEETKTLVERGLVEVDAFQQELFWPVLKAMQRGVRVDIAERARFNKELTTEIAKRHAFFLALLGHPLNPASVKQMRTLFYSDFKLPVVWKMTPKGKVATLDDKALVILAQKEPIVRPLIRAIQELRSLSVFRSTFVEMELDEDRRMRCSYNICGTETYRFNSSKNAFGTGGNLQNVPKGGEEDDSDLVLPNVRRLFIPDEGMEFFDIDLSKADLRVVVWESDCTEMKAMLAEGRDPYIETAREFYRDPTINKLLPNGNENPKYRMFKSFGHGCLTAGHEVLTPDGWMRIEDYDESVPLMSWSTTDWSAKFEVPEKFTRDLGVHFVKVEGQSYSVEMTHDHTVPYTTDTTMRSCKASELPPSARLPMCGYFSGEEEVPDSEAQLLAAFQADGSVDAYGNVCFHFHKGRKILRLKELLGESEYSYKDGKFYVPRRSAWFAKYGKIAGSYLLRWCGRALDTFLEELVYWDGNGCGTVLCRVSSTSKEHCDWLQTVAKLRGYGSQVRLQRAAEGNRQDLWQVSLNTRKYCNLASSPASEVYETHPRAVYCPTTSTGFFFVRRNGTVLVTGNTHYLGTSQGLAQRLGLTNHEAARTQAWYLGKYAAIKRWQERFIEGVRLTHCVSNRFGYVRNYFGRIDDSTFREAIAWLPQSTVGCLINRIWVNIHRAATPVEVLLQVHDSLAGQFPIDHRGDSLAIIKQAAQVVIPYSDPLIIPIGIKTSVKSWGDC